MLVVNLEVNGKLVHHLAVTTVVTDKALVKKYVKILGVTRVNQLCIQKMQGSGCLTSVNPLGSNAFFYPPGTLWVADNPDFRSGFKGYQHTLAEGPKNFLFGELWKKGLGVLFPRIDFGTFLFEKFTGVPTKE